MVKGTFTYSMIFFYFKFQNVCKYFSELLGLTFFLHENLILVILRSSINSFDIVGQRS